LFLPPERTIIVCPLFPLLSTSVPGLSKPVLPPPVASHLVGPDFSTCSLLLPDNITPGKKHGQGGRFPYIQPSPLGELRNFFLLPSFSPFLPSSGEKAFFEFFSPNSVGLFSFFLSLLLPQMAGLGLFCSSIQAFLSYRGRVALPPMVVFLMHSYTPSGLLSTLSRRSRFVSPSPLRTFLILGFDLLPAFPPLRC